MLLENSKTIYVEQDYSSYTEAEHLNWNFLLERQLLTVKDKACKEFIQGLEIVEPLIRELPRLSLLSKQLEEKLGWRIVDVNGLLAEEEFFKSLLYQCFPVNVSLRKNENSNFDPLPDLFHDCFGHLPLLANPVYSDFIKKMSNNFLIGSQRQKQNISTLFWYTIEAGVCYENEQLKVYGTSQLSSFHEIAYSISGQPKLHDFNLQKIVKLQPYPYAFQEEIFAIPTFEYLTEISSQMDWLMKN